MESRIASELKLRCQPVAIIFTNEKPEGALQFEKGRWACVIAMLDAAAKGKTAVFDRDTCGCGGGAIGLGFKDDFGHTPGGIEYFLSTGRGEGYPEGEGFKKTPELARTFVEQLPATVIPYTYVVFKPLGAVDPAREAVQLVCMLVNADQMSALGALANYGRPGAESVIMPFGAGCHTICILPLNESQKDLPRAVVGLTDVTARPYIDADLVSFTVPFAMFQEMESNVPGSFLEKKVWKKLQERIK